MADFNYAEFAPAIGEALIMQVNAVREQVAVIGSPLPLIGILTKVTHESRHDCAMLLLNSGVLHRVGSCRLSVEVARGITEQTGMPTLRFDYSGLGDSAARRSELGRDALARSEIIEVMNHLQESQGIKQFILFGLCSGARDAVHAAAEDSRVVGVVQLDGYAYRNWQYYFTHYRERVLSMAVWRRFFVQTLPDKVRQLFDRLAAKSSGSTQKPLPEAAVDMDWGDYLPRSEVACVYHKLAQRGVRLFVHFTGSWGDQYNYPGQFFDMFSDVDFGKTVHAQFCPEVDHIHSDPQARRELINAIAAWVKAEMAGRVES